MLKSKLFHAKTTTFHRFGRAVVASVCLGLLGQFAMADQVPGTPTERVHSHLAAGEFGLAAEVATQVADATLKSELLAKVADAQRDSGEFSASLATTKKIPSQLTRKTARSKSLQEESLNGGFGADFEPLMELLRAETGSADRGDNWEENAGIGTMNEFESGVRVDPNGVLSRLSQRDLAGRLDEISRQARIPSINSDMAQASQLRMVSLTRLEKAAAQRLAEGKPVVESMKQLAGLSKVQYVFVYPEDGEIIIAGPAESWQFNESGIPVGTVSGRPILQLDDLVTLLRTFSPNGERVFTCSIDPRAENLQALKDFVEKSQSNGPLAPGSLRRWADQLGETLGMQDISIKGVPRDSRVARVIVDADYRMKLIGIGKLEAGEHIPNYFSLMAANRGPVDGRIDALRWWMTMKYDQVLHSPDHTAFEIKGSSVLCQSENEFVNNQGERVHTGNAEPLNRQFAANFTDHYSELAQMEPVFADMQGIFDLALVAAIIDSEQLTQRSHWNRGAFAVNGSYLPARFPEPREVHTVVNHRVFRGNNIVAQVAGGVRGDVASVLKNPEIRQESVKLAKPASLPANQWWWDVK